MALTVYCKSRPHLCLCKMRQQVPGGGVKQVAIVQQDDAGPMCSCKLLQHQRQQRLRGMGQAVTHMEEYAIQPCCSAKVHVVQARICAFYWLVSCRQAVLACDEQSSAPSLA